MSQSACPFASASIAEHLARGAAAAGLLVLTYVLLHDGGIARTAGAVGSLAGAIALMRGCPTCWSVGLVATIGAARRGHQTARASVDPSSIVPPRPATVPAPR